MRIALLSDIHGNLAALEAVARDLARRGADQVATLGDLISGPLLPQETAAFLMAAPWTHLAGNHERQMLAAEAPNPSDRYALSRIGAAERTWLAGLPASRVLAGEVFLCHGTPASDTGYFLESVDSGGSRPATREEVEARMSGLDWPVIACGHTHIPRIVRTARGRLLVNPGSVGMQAYSDELPFPHVMASGSPEARYAVLEKRHGAWEAELVAVPYDPEPMARLATLRGRAEWAKALMTGRLG